MTTDDQRHLLEADGWSVLLWDELYNAQHVGGRFLLKSSVKYWAMDRHGQDGPIPYGNVEQPAWGTLMKKLIPSPDELVPLAFDAILALDGKVFDLEREAYESIEKWLEAKGYPPELVEVHVIAHTGKARSSRDGLAHRQAQSQHVPF